MPRWAGSSADQASQRKNNGDGAIRRETRHPFAIHALPASGVPRIQQTNALSAGRVDYLGLPTFKVGALKVGLSMPLESIA